MAARKRVASTRHRAVPDPLARAVGARIRSLRKAADWDFDAFVEATQLGRGTVSEIERGMLVPGLHALAKIANALDLTIADLVVGTSIREQLFVKAAELRDSEVKALLRDAERRAEAQPKG